MGAIECLYTVFSYRPEVIASTSVGSINAIALAQAENDDEALAQARKLRRVWDSLTGPREIYEVHDWVSRLTHSDSLDLGAGVNIRIEDAIIQFIFEHLLANAEKTTSLATLGPLFLSMLIYKLVTVRRVAVAHEETPGNGEVSASSCQGSSCLFTLPRPGTPA